MVLEESVGLHASKLTTIQQRYLLDLGPRRLGGSPSCLVHKLATWLYVKGATEIAPMSCLPPKFRTLVGGRAKVALPEVERRMCQGKSLGLGGHGREQALC